MPKPPSPKPRAPLTINGQLIDLSHLSEPFTRRLDLKLPGGMVKKNVEVEFKFTCHCYSRSPHIFDDGSKEAIPPGMLVADGSPKQPRNRIFCPDRYELSKLLPGCLAEMVAQDGAVTRTQHLNYFHIKHLSHNVQGLVSPANYFIFMGIRIVRPEEYLAKRFRVTIESAHVDSKTGGRYSRAFSQALGEIWSGQA
jgi:hypothetical protein